MASALCRRDGGEGGQEEFTWSSLDFFRCIFNLKIEWQVWCAGEMVAIRREKKEEYLMAPDLVGEVAVLTGCLPELNTRSLPSPVCLCICASVHWRV